MIQPTRDLDFNFLTNLTIPFTSLCTLLIYTAQSGYFLTLYKLFAKRNTFISLIDITLKTQ